MAKNDAIMVIAVGAAAILGLSYLKEKYGGAADSATKANDAYQGVKESVTNVIYNPAGTGQAVAESLFGAGVNAAAWYLNYQQGFTQGMVNVAHDTVQTLYDKFTDALNKSIPTATTGGGGGGVKTGSAVSPVSYESLKAASESIQSSYPVGSLAELPVAQGMRISDIMTKATSGSSGSGSSATSLVSSGGSTTDKGYGVTASGIRYDTKVKELR